MMKKTMIVFLLTFAAFAEKKVLITFSKKVTCPKAKKQLIDFSISLNCENNKKAFVFSGDYYGKKLIKPELDRLEKNKLIVNASLSKD